MSMSDPIADMLTRIRNAQAVNKAQVRIPSSNLKSAIASVMQDEGYITSFTIDGNQHCVSQFRQLFWHWP